MITWKIEGMIVKPQEGSLTDVVVTAHYRCIATDQNFAASNYGSTGFSAPSENFIAYADLTEQTVLDWCYANGVDKDAVEANVLRELNILINPPTVTLPLPWGAA